MASKVSGIPRHQTQTRERERERERERKRSVVHIAIFRVCGCNAYGLSSDVSKDEFMIKRTLM
jgi:hypothetical protein